MVSANTRYPLTVPDYIPYSEKFSCQLQMYFEFHGFLSLTKSGTCLMWSPSGPYNVAALDRWLD